MIKITNSVGVKSKYVHQINKSERKGHSSELYRETDISRILSPVPDAWALFSTENRFSAIQFHSNQHLIKMLSPKSQHFEKQIVIERLHTLSRIRCSNFILSCKHLTQYAPDYAEDFCPT